MINLYVFIVLGIVIYLHIEGALYAQKSVPSWFLAVFDSKIEVPLKFEKSCQFFDAQSFRLYTIFVLIDHSPVGRIHSEEWA